MYLTNEGFENQPLAVFLSYNSPVYQNYNITNLSENKSFKKNMKLIRQIKITIPFIKLENKSVYIILFELRDLMC